MCSAPSTPPTETLRGLGADVVDVNIAGLEFERSRASSWRKLPYHNRTEPRDYRRSSATPARRAVYRR
ncbi:MAG: hypothetical protein U5Q44_08155 [Dehalococcoidia bacterium]|nr:hypothetical protein [Dehalococcoidia bacterium]